ncbi:MAG: DNA polymerase, partial [Anaerovorax sp.]
KNYKKYTKVKEFMDDSVAACKGDGYVRTIMGRKRTIQEIHASNYNVRQLGERLAMNTPIQGSAADIIKLAMIRVYEQLKAQKLKSKLVLQVHDELIIETYVDELEVVKKLLKENMEHAIELNVKLTADVNVGENWYELK